MFHVSKVLVSSGFQNESECEIDFRKITIIVGPNNSGKSTLLKDIQNWFGGDYPKAKLLRNVTVGFSENIADYDEFKADILKFRDGDIIKKGQTELIPFVKKHLFEDAHENPVWYNLDDIFCEFKLQNTEYFRHNFFRYFIVRLDGKSRLQLAHGGQYHIWRTSKTPFNYLSTLYLNTDEQENLAEIVNEEFGWYTYFKKGGKNVIDIFLDKRLRIENSHLGDNSHSGPLEQILLTEFGDGVQCFVGICLSVLSCPFRVVMIDEPEAYLHPPTAYSLGSNLTRWAKQRHRSLIISTHSSEFLMGCLESIPPSDISIVRLTYENKISTINKLDDAEVSYYAKDPLLRSSDVLNALFYHYAVVTEGYDDRVIYQEVNKKLLKPKQTGKTIFLNTNGKNSVHRIVNALRKIGIPVAAIYDFDVLKKQKSRKENKTLWELILSTCNIESHKFNRLESERQYIESGIRTLNKQKGKSEDGGYFKHLNPHEIPSALYAKICSLLDELKEYGIFIVPVGEIEHWLKTVPDSDNDFLINMLNKIDKTEPTGDDIWKFINGMDSWLTSPNRKGMKP